MTKTEDTQIIPQDRLVPAPENVRKASPIAGTADLEASIQARGLLQNLIVYPEMNGRKKTGNFAVAGGERRRRSIAALVERNALAADFGVRCLVRSRDEAVALSLAENAVRENMTPVDQFRAFSALIETEGATVADVAAQFAVSELMVRQRLKLARLSPRILAELEANRMSLDQAKALTLSEDHAVQERAWFDAPAYYREAHSLRERISEDFVRPTDPRAVLVGLDAYKEAGGHVVADLFDTRHSYLADVALLDQLTQARLDEIASEIRAEGWKWVETHATSDFHRMEFVRTYPTEPVLSDEDAERLAALTAELNELVPDDPDEPASWDVEDDEDEEGFTDELSDDEMSDEELADDAAAQGADEATVEAEASVDLERIAAIKDEILRLTAPTYAPEVKATCGVVVMLANMHSAKAYRIERGLMRLEDIPQSDPVEGVEPGAATAKAPASPGAGLSYALVESLTAHKTAAMRIELARAPGIALRATAHTLAISHVYDGLSNRHSRSCLTLSYTEDYLRAYDPAVKTAPAALALEAELEAWRARLPQSNRDLWDWLLQADDDTVMGLLAVAVASSLTAVERAQVEGREPTHADRLAQALGLDVANWWEATPESYFDRVSKKLISAAVTEGVSPEAAENIAGLKKGAMAKIAAERLQGRRWLPEILRTAVPPAVEPSAMPEDMKGGDGIELPEEPFAQAAE